MIEELGFRSIAWEEGWATGLEIDNYIRTGEGDLDAIVREMSPQWQSREVANVLRWFTTTTRAAPTRCELDLPMGVVGTQRLQPRLPRHDRPVRRPVEYNYEDQADSSREMLRGASGPVNSQG